jgi:hypothetical protein
MAKIWSLFQNLNPTWSKIKILKAKRKMNTAANLTFPNNNIVLGPNEQ